jgi:hypothetical protein
MDENSATMESLKNTFLDKLKRIIRQMLHKDDEAVFYDVEILRSGHLHVQERSPQLHQFRQIVERKTRLLATLTTRTASASKRLEPPGGAGARCVGEKT